VTVPSFLQTLQKCETPLQRLTISISYRSSDHLWDVYWLPNSLTYLRICGGSIVLTIWDLIGNLSNLRTAIFSGASVSIYSRQSLQILASLAKCPHLTTLYLPSDMNNCTN